MGRRKFGERPRITLHKPSGLARVRVGGKEHYLGKYGSISAIQKYKDVCRRFGIELDWFSELDEIHPSEDEYLSIPGMHCCQVEPEKVAPFGSMEGFHGMYPSIPSDWYFPSMQPSEVPDVSAVYIVLNVRGEAKYVGETGSLRRRFVEHKQWMKSRDRFAWVEVDATERLYVQAYFISALRPIKNRLPGRGKHDCLRQSATNIQPAKVSFKMANNPSKSSNGCHRPRLIQEATDGR
jgi:hypothetical protein